VGLAASPGDIYPNGHEVIYSIPLCTQRQEDCWAWHYERKGIFSVRSAYWMLIHNREKREAWIENSAGKSSYKSKEKEWTDLWSVKVPSKVWNFLWRLARHSLATTDVCHHRHMAEASVCTLCGSEDSRKHSLLECNMARCVWALEGEEMLELLQSFQLSDAKSWLAEMLNTLSHSQRTCVVVILWAIWHARRKAIHEEIYQSPLSTKCFVDSYIEELASMQSEQPKGKVALVMGNPKPQWLAPPEGMMKINGDASVSKNLKVASVVVVALDTAGSFLGASVMVLEGILDPETLDVLACREGLALASDLGLQRFRMVSDCINAVRSIQEGSLGSCGNVIKEIRFTLSTFVEAELVHKGGDANVDADRLAKSSTYSSLGRHVWFLDPPEGVSNSPTV
jgi:hypothetical protein